MFDDKGSRLDSIYIMAGDITLGEQLESDRYYILVEEVKKATDMKGSSVQQNKSMHKNILLFSFVIRQII